MQEHNTIQNASCIGFMGSMRVRPFGSGILFSQTHRGDLQRSRNVDYTSSGSILEIASNQVAPQLPPVDLSEPVRAQPIGIGHSMGGLVARSIEQNFRGSQRRFCAIITVGTPNKGATIINNIQNGSVVAVLKHGIRIVLTPFAIEAGVALASLGYVTKVTSDLGWPFATVLAGVAVGEIANRITEHYRGVIERYTTPPSIDMKVGSSFLSDLDTQYHQVPVIAIWVNEDPRTAYRLAWTFLIADQIPSLPLDQTYDDILDRDVSRWTEIVRGYKLANWFNAAFHYTMAFLTGNVTAAILASVYSYTGKKFEELEW